MSLFKRKGLYLFFKYVKESSRYLEGVFAAYDKDIKNIIGTKITFGNIFGKDLGYIQVVMDKKDFVLLTRSSPKIKKSLLSIGVNPFNYGIKEVNTVTDTIRYYYPNTRKESIGVYGLMVKKIDLLKKLVKQMIAGGDL